MWVEATSEAFKIKGPGISWVSIGDEWANMEEIAQECRG
jgi:hypothetical protein